MNPTKKQILEILPHIIYEMEILFNLPSVRGTNFYEYAIIESRLIHARNLKNFFEAKTRKLDDAISKDFGFPQKNLGISIDIEERFNKDLAHITYSRLKRTPETKKWVYANFITPLIDRCIEFAQFVTQKYKAEISETDFKRLNRLINTKT